MYNERVGNLEQRYYSLSEFFRKEYGEKVYKLSLDGGFSCPNRKKGRGCLFCSEKGSGEFTSGRIPIKEQIVDQKKRVAHKKVKKYFAYFQNFTNTYGRLEDLRVLYEEALIQEDIVGLSIATRPDCLGPDVLDLLEGLNKETHLIIELGFQTSKEETARFIRRGYPSPVFYQAVRDLSERKIKVLAHIIAGLPYEDKKDFLQTIEDIKGLPLWGIKFHSLYIQRDSDLYDTYKTTPFPLLEKEDYIDWVCDALERIPPYWVVNRLTGDADKKLLYLPKWSADKLSVLGSIQRELKTRGSTQGRYFRKGIRD